MTYRTQSTVPRAKHGGSAALSLTGNPSPEECRRRVSAWRRPYTPGPLTEQEFGQFWTNGFVLKHKLFVPQELSPVCKSVDHLVDLVARNLYAAGKIKNLHANAGFYKRLTLLEKEYPGCTVLLHKQGILPSEISTLWTDSRLLDIAQQLVGPEIAGHPVWNLRCKTPQNEQATVPWHQDTAYLEPSCWGTLQLTAWIPLIDATRRNGCMQVLRGGHLSGITVRHVGCTGNTWYVEIPTEELKRLGVSEEKDIVTCEVPYGSVLLLNNLIPHRSLENLSDQIRWSLDLRWQQPDKANGFYGIKDNILMRTARDSSYRPDWDAWNRKNRSVLQEQAVRHETVGTKALNDDRFDTTIAGPWMNQWPLLHHNKHTAAFKPDKGTTSWHAA